MKTKKNLSAKIERELTALKFSTPNSKLKALKKYGYRISTFSLPSGWTCPGAASCKAKVGREGGITDGANIEFRCFAASQEAVYKDTRNQRWHNFDLLKPFLKDARAMADLISAALPPKANVIRIHIGGDFFNVPYFLAWCLVASEHPAITFYAYTKSLRTWIDNRASVPENLVLTASRGGLFDGLIDKHGLKSARVVFSIEQADALGLPIDHDDIHAIDRNCNQFALLVHNTQPAGSAASKAVVALHGLGSYSGKAETDSKRAAKVDSARLT